MSSRIHPVIVLMITALVCVSQAAKPKPPYEAQVVGDNVNIYSSPSTTDSYVCGKVSSTDTVTVVRTQGQWSKIMPVEGCFSWISIEYVELDKNMPNIGMVTGNSVRVWAGSENLSPLRSKKSQTYLNKGELVTMLGPIKDEYYKIVPPVGAYLWIKNNKIKYVEQVTQKSIKPSEFKPVIPPTEGPTQKPFMPTEPEKVKPVKPTEPAKPVKPVVVKPVTPKPEPKPTIKTVTKPVVVKPSKPAAIETKPIETKPITPKPVEITKAPKPVKPVSTEAAKLKECYAIKDLLDAERSKPIEKQNYEPIIKQIQSVISDPRAGKAKKYAEYELALAKRYDYAVKINDKLKGQEQKLDDNLKQVKANYIARTATIPKTAQYTVVGVIRKSHIYNEEHSQQRYTITNETGKIVCYAIPERASARSIARSMEGKRVGLKGTVSKDPENAITVVRFTQINEIE